MVANGGRVCCLWLKYPPSSDPPLQFFVSFVPSVVKIRFQNPKSTAGKIVPVTSPKPTR